jgi:hypothetical protein
MGESILNVLELWDSESVLPCIYMSICIYMCIYTCIDIYMYTYKCIKYTYIYLMGESILNVLELWDSESVLPLPLELFI